MKGNAIEMRMPKLLTEIILASNDRILKKFPIDGERIIIHKGKKGYGGKEWAPKFSNGCIVIWKAGIWPFKSLKRKVVVKDGAEECIDFSKEPLLVPSWDKHAADEYWKAQAIKHAGAVEVKASVPIVFYIGLIISVFTLILVLSQGRIRF